MVRRFPHSMKALLPTAVEFLLCGQHSNRLALPHRLDSHDFPVAPPCDAHTLCRKAWIDGIPGLRYGPDMRTIIHKVEYVAGREPVATAFWMGPLEGIIEIAKANMAKKGATWARIVVESTEEEVWTGA